MAYRVTQSTATQLPAILTTSGTGVVRTGLTYADVSVEFRRSTDSAFVFKPLIPSDLTEVGNGLYLIAFSTDDLRATGMFHYVVTGQPQLSPAINIYVGDAEVTVDATPGTVKSVPMNNLTGNLVDLSGSPLAGQGVSARLIARTVIGGTLSVGLGSDSVSTTTDSNGFFVLPVAQGVQVEVVIPAINYRRILTVPATSTTALFAVP